MFESPLTYLKHETYPNIRRHSEDFGCIWRYISTQKNRLVYLEKLFGDLDRKIKFFEI